MRAVWSHNKVFDTLRLVYLVWFLITEPFRRPVRPTFWEVLYDSVLFKCPCHRVAFKPHDCVWGRGRALCHVVLQLTTVFTLLTQCCLPVVWFYMSVGCFICYFSSVEHLNGMKLFNIRVWVPALLPLQHLYCQVVRIFISFVPFCSFFFLCFLHFNCRKQDYKRTIL